MKNDYLTLVADTLSLLKEQKKRTFFVSEEEKAFLQEPIIVTETKADEPKPSLPKKEIPPPLPKKPPLEKPKAPVIQEKKEEKVFEKKVIEKAVPSSEKLMPPPLSFEEIKKVMASIAPNYVLNEKIPDDEKAKQIGQSWFYKKNGAAITLLYGKEDPMKIAFLKNVEKALSSCYAPARLVSIQEIEKEHGWDLFFENKEIKLIIAPSSSIQEFAKLMSYVREFPSRDERMLKEIPLLLICDISLYFKKSSLKALLWKTLQQKIKELFPHE